MADLDRYLQIRWAAAGGHTADSGAVVFVTTITGVPQAWSVPAGGGWPEQLTFGEDRVASVHPSPSDPDVVVFGRDAGGNERTQLHLVRPDGSGERPLAVVPSAIHSFGEHLPGGDVLFCATRRNGVDFDLYRQRLDGDDAELVVELDGWNMVAAVDEQGRRALLTKAHSNVHTEALVIDLEDRTTAPLAASEGDPRRFLPAGFTPDGRAAFVLSDREGDFLQAWRVGLDGHGWERFGPEGGDVELLVVRHGAGALVANEGGVSRLLPFDPATLEVGDPVELPAGVVSDLSIAPDGATALFSLSGAASPPDVWEAGLAGAGPGPAGARRVTRSSTAGIDPATFVAPELVSVPSFDGLEVPLWLYRPPGVERPPVVVSVHGGPEAQERPAFNAFYQYLLARGIAVAAPNVRGSTGYGRTYTALDDVERRPDSVEDLAEVGRWLKSSGAVDPSRVAVMGGSYGGFMVLATLTRHPDLWAAGVDIVGIANLVTFLENTGAYRRALREAEYGSLEGDRALLESLSPIHAVDRIEAPLLVIHGANDPRVPVGEAAQIVESLRRRQRPVSSLVFDDEGHGIVKLANRRTAYRAVSAFLDEHLAAGAG
jgi:dienelactone hydrolase